MTLVDFPALYYLTYNFILSKSAKCMEKKTNNQKRGGTCTEDLSGGKININRT